VAEPTLTDVFGAGASQTLTDITISKSALTSFGLVADADNKAEQIMAALIKHQMTVLTSTAQASNADQSIVVEQGFDNLVTRGTTQYYATTVNVTFSKEFPQTGIDVSAY
jgi:hypothetical protein